MATADPVIPDAPLEVLQWAERAAEGAQKQLLDSAKILADQANTTLTVLLAGIGGAATLASRLFETAPFVKGGGPAPAAAVGALLACLLLIALVLLLVQRCMANTAIPLIYNEPMNLIQPGGWDLRSALLSELAHRQAAIDQLRRRNSERGLWLNRVRIAAAAGVPIAFVIGAGLAAR